MTYRRTFQYVATTPTEVGVGVPYYKLFKH
nr:MAG TPA: hypothetical protein [Caudoviricetes sp.]